MSAMRASLLLLLSLAPGCSDVARYNSQDLTGLPCEPSTEQFFYPIEFTADGGMPFPSQRDQIEFAIRDLALTDIFVFVHGWDKTASTAERDYQDFICRLYREVVRSPIGGRSRAVIIGVFWPSTVFSDSSDPLPLKPFTYRVIRNRASTIARTGFNEVLIRTLASEGARPRAPLRYHFIGHSFGGKIIREGFASYLSKSQDYDWLRRAEAVNFVQLLPATVSEQYLPETRDDLAYSLLKARIYVVFSQNDFAGRFLFRMMEGHCSVGACGDPRYSTFDATAGGICLRSKRPSVLQNLLDAPELTANIDATAIVHGHTDIYKGRVASLIWALLRRDLDKATDCGP
jgi:hypothetical protein